MSNGIVKDFGQMEAWRRVWSETWAKPKDPDHHIGQVKPFKSGSIPASRWSAHDGFWRSA